MTGDQSIRQTAVHDAIGQPWLTKLCLRSNVSLFLLYLILNLVGCGTGGPELTSENSKTGELEPNFLLNDSTPLPGNHKQRANIVSARPSQDEEKDEEQEGDEAAGDKKTAFEPDPENFRVKPNHWVAIQNEGFSKKEDFNGVLTHSMRKANQQPRALSGTRYFMRTRRPASLAKEQLKKFEVPAYIPDVEAITYSPQLKTLGGSDVVTELDRLLKLEPHQYHMVLLTDAPESYRFMNVLPSVWNLRLNRHLQDVNFSMGSEEEFDFTGETNTMELGALSYKLTISDWDDAPELPSNVQQWTSIAYLIWTDGFSPEDLSVDQQQAIIDWLHFGGQLLVCADAIDTLSDSFLAPYLPVRPTGKENSDGQQMNRLVQSWSLQRDSNGQLVHPTFTSDDKLVLTTWEKRAAGQDLANCAGLAVEQEVGRGRVTCVAFPLNYNKLRSWSSFDNWFNACVLRRPGRKFHDLDAFNSFEVETRMDDGFNWLDVRKPHDQPSFYSNVRFLSRDWTSRTADSYLKRMAGPQYVGDSILDSVDRRFHNDNPDSSPGAWNDYSAFASAARETLKDQAGITPPKREWVLKALLLYLAVLVPGNYLVFRLIGKLEWAWFSIPAISVLGGIAVVRAASLDIGFSNKQLQVNVVEMVPEYDRVHIAGFGSLYSSLTTSFRYSSDNPTTLTLPFPTANVPTELDEPRPAEFTFNVGKNVTFGPQSVLSNTMEMFHFEQVASVGGTIHYRGDRVVDNQSSMNLQDVFVLRHNPNVREMEYARVGELKAGQTTTLEWKTLDEMSQLYLEFAESPFNDLKFELDLLLDQLALAEIVFDTTSWNDLAAFYHDTAPDFSEAIIRFAERIQMPVGEKMTYEMAMDALKDARLGDGINLGRFSRIAANYPLGPGEVRLFGWSIDKIHDVKIEPDASQSDVRNFVVAHLRRPALPQIESDINLAYSPRNKLELKASDQDGEEQTDGNEF